MWGRVFWAGALAWSLASLAGHLFGRHDLSARIQQAATNLFAQAYSAVVAALAAGVFAFRVAANGVSGLLDQLGLAVSPLTIEIGATAAFSFGLAVLIAKQRFPSSNSLRRIFDPQRRHRDDVETTRQRLKRGRDYQTLDPRLDWERIAEQDKRTLDQLLEEYGRRWGKRDQDRILAKIVTFLNSLAFEFGTPECRNAPFDWQSGCSYRKEFSHAQFAFRVVLPAFLIAVGVAVVSSLLIFCL